MFRRFSLISVILVAALSVGCASKKKDGEAGAAGGGDSADISSTDFNFNSQGSDSGQIPGLSTVNFAYDSSSLDSSSREKLKGNAEWMNKNKSLTIQIEGHCDANGSVEYNLALGERRANSVKQYLVGLGVDAARLTIISYGKEKLVELGDTESVHAKNRRANFVPLAN